jgi:hypothetical protein
MDRKDFYEVLESALLSFDEISEEDLVKNCGFNKVNSKIGIKLCNYLKSIKSREIKK